MHSFCECGHVCVRVCEGQSMRFLFKTLEQVSLNLLFTLNIAKKESINLMGNIYMNHLNQSSAPLLHSNNQH